MPRTWVVVADSAAARLFLAPSPTGPLEEFASYVHAEGRMHARDLVAGEQGRSFDSMGAGRHALEPRVDPKEQEKASFARLIGDRVRSARAKGEVNRVFLVAPPEFLGLLRASLDAESRRMVEGEYGLNVVRLKPEQIRARLPERLYSAIPTP